ncbi:MAG TPA: hypothetical protein VF591_14325 [Pyrinomonadaceae bacterium]|jgi:hypothetical protein
MSKTTLSLFLIVGEGDQTYRLFSLWILALILAVILFLKSFSVRIVDQLYQRLCDRDPLTLIAFTYLTVIAVLGISELVFTLVNKPFLSLWKASNISRDYIVFAIPLIILVVLSILEWKRSKFLNQKLKWIHRRPFLIITCITFVILAVVIFFEESGLFEKSTYNHFQNSNLINIFSIIGIFGTIVGLVITYEQLKLAEDRIDGYESLYDALDELLHDNKARFFQFYGATLIPGHAAFGDSNVIKTYENNLSSFLNDLPRNQQAIIIAPSPELYHTTYSPYLNNKYRNETFTQEVLDLLVDDVQKFHRRLVFSNLKIITIEEKKDIEFISAYYYSNGRMVIYAVPLHYELERAKEIDNKPETNSVVEIEPVLVGFKTTNRSVIKAFEKDFLKRVKTREPK